MRESSHCCFFITKGVEHVLKGRGIQMGIIVQKFGGTSVGSPERIINVANRIVQEVNEGNQVVVVVSAMGKTTDQLVGLAADISNSPRKREMDMLLSTGEQVTIALLTIALHEKGYEAISYTGWQAGIQTEPLHSNARITDIDISRVKQSLDDQKIVVVAGFQGVSAEGEITTLGRGGSDTTAVALAAALKAEKCDIYTDVTGVFTTDPRFVPTARKLQSISYDEMLELANLGAGVLHPRAVEFAKNYDMPLEVRSSIEFENGTIIEEEVSMEKNLVVRGIAFEDQVTRVTVCGLPNGLQTLSTIFGTLAKEGINVDIIIQSTYAHDKTNISFSVKTIDLNETIQVLERNQEQLRFDEIQHESGLAKVSIVGSGMVSNPGVAADMFQVLANEDIQVKMVSTSEIKVSTVIEQEFMIKAVEALHEAFNLQSITTEKTEVRV